MIDEIFVCYLLKINKGSEWLLGENKFRALGRSSYIVTANHQLGDDFRDGSIGPFSYKRKNGRIAVVGMYGGKSEPKTPMGFRLDYLIWSLKVYALLRKRAARTKIRHNNFAQVLTPIPKPVYESPNFLFGPVGGQGPWYKVQFLPFRYKVINYLIFRGIYSAIADRIRRMNVIFVHPILAERFGCSQIQPAIQLRREVFIERKKAPRVIHVSRRVYFKLPDLHRRLFEDLSDLHPELDFTVIGSGWGEFHSRNNLRFCDSLTRDEIMLLFSESRFHVNLSLELAGIVNLEAALNKCITIGATKSGAEYLLGLKGDYLVDLYDPAISMDDIVSQVSKIIRLYDETEAERQFIQAQQHTFISSIDIVDGQVACGNLNKRDGRSVSLSYIFVPDGDFISEQRKSKHFVNHHSFLEISKKGFVFNRERGEFFVDGKLLKMTLDVLGIKHVYVPGALYLADRLKNTMPDACFFALPNKDTAGALLRLGYAYGMVLPIVREENLLDTARKIVEAAAGKLVIMGIGSPNQDLLAQEIVKLDDRLEVLCVGAAVEFLAGTQKSPPAAVRKAGFEWLWRLATNFRVTLPRVTTSVAGFLMMLLSNKVKR